LSNKEIQPLDSHPFYRTEKGQLVKKKHKKEAGPLWNRFF